MASGRRQWSEHQALRTRGYGDTLGIDAPEDILSVCYFLPSFFLPLFSTTNFQDCKNVRLPAFGPRPFVTPHSSIWAIRQWRAIRPGHCQTAPLKSY
jgi:hypothetical protein